MRRLLFLTLLWLGLAGPALAKPDLLILVSMDGFRWDYLQRGKTPNLSALAAAGAQGAMRPSYPSQTFPNHYTLVTGLRPDHHGIVDNNMRDAALGKFTMETGHDPRWWSQGEPLWVTADNRGLKTATMFWPGSDTKIRDRLPDYWMAYDKAFLADQRVDKVLSWLDLPPDRRPDFVTLYFDLVDTEGHHHGPNSPQLQAALASTDAAVGKLVAGLRARGLYERTNLILVADHGMADTSKDRVVYIDDIAGGPMAIDTVTTGTSVGLSIPEGAPRGTLARLLAPHDHLRCWKKGDLPKAFHYGTNRRIPPMVCLADPGWFVTTHERLASMTDFNVGNHGYDPATPEMAAVFIAEGPAFEAGRTLPPFDNVDVQPLMAQLLHIRAPNGDGSAAVFKSVLTPH